MAVMKLVIDIDESIYRHFMNNEYSRADIIAVHTAIVNGSPLPKGHGKLIDADKLIPDCQEDFVYYDDDEHNVFTAVGIAQIECADTIIQAEKEEK